jgi:hypothetical protein
MCGLIEHIEREIRARQQAERDQQNTADDTPNTRELLGTSVKIVV